MSFDFLSQTTTVEALALLSPWIYYYLIIQSNKNMHPLGIFRWRVTINKWFWRISGINASLLIIFNLKDFYQPHALCMFIYLLFLTTKHRGPIKINRYNADSFLTYGIDFINHKMPTKFYDFVMYDLKQNIDTLIDILDDRKGSSLLREKVYNFFETLSKTRHWDTFIRVYIQEESNNRSLDILYHRSIETAERLSFKEKIKTEEKRKILESIFYTENNPHHPFMQSFIMKILDNLN